MPIAFAAGQLEGTGVSTMADSSSYSDWAYDTDEGHGIEPVADCDTTSLRAVELTQALGASTSSRAPSGVGPSIARWIAEAPRRGLRVTGHCRRTSSTLVAARDGRQGEARRIPAVPRGDGVIYDDLVQLLTASAPHWPWRPDGSPIHPLRCA
jgi:hypothetical protein